MCAYIYIYTNPLKCVSETAEGHTFVFTLIGREYIDRHVFELYK